MGTPTSWLSGDAPDGCLLGTLTPGQLSGVRSQLSTKKHPLIALVGQLPEKEQKKFQKKLWNVLFFSIFCVPLHLGY